jgi:hypothetical protein
MFLRCANGRVCDLELEESQRTSCSTATCYILHQVEYGDPVTDRREKTCPVWCEEQVSSAVDGAEQVGKLHPVSRVTWQDRTFVLPGSRSSSWRIRRQVLLAHCGGSHF